MGNGSTTDVTKPEPLHSLSEDVTQVVAGTHHTLVLTAEGKIFSWGKNDTGALGHGDSHIDMYSLEEFPRLIESPELTDNVVFIAAGSGRSAAVTSDGRLFLWGRNMGHTPAALGNKAFGGLKVPISLSSLLIQFLIDYSVLIWFFCDNFFCSLTVF